MALSCTQHVGAVRGGPCSNGRRGHPGKMRDHAQHTGVNAHLNAIGSDLISRALGSCPGEGPLGLEVRRIRRLLAVAASTALVVFLVGAASAGAATRYYQAAQATPEVAADDGLGP